MEDLMAVDMFIKIGDVKGESKDDSHKGEIDVLSWSWGVSNSGTAHTGGGMGAGKVNVHDLTLTKYVDLSSPDLLLACCNGKHIPEATLTVRKAGESPLEYLKIKLTDVMVTSVNTGGSSGGDDRLTETLTLNFGKVNVDYVEQTEKGAAGGKPKMGWDVAANKKL
jgi:type VI secretion system secreted protein Hcp